MFKKKWLDLVQVALLFVLVGISFVEKNVRSLILWLWILSVELFIIDRNNHK
jgi:hypothetical protein